MGRREAGRALDMEIATLVFGRALPSVDEMRACAERVWRDQPMCTRFTDLGGFFAYEVAGGKIEYAPQVNRYSEDIGAAWQVVEKMQARGCDFSLERNISDRDDDGLWTCHMPRGHRSRKIVDGMGTVVGGEGWYDSYGSAVAPTAALAICYAALDSERQAGASSLSGQTENPE